MTISSGAADCKEKRVLWEDQFPAIGQQMHHYPVICRLMSSLYQ